MWEEREIRDWPKSDEFYLVRHIMPLSQMGGAAAYKKQVYQSQRPPYWKYLGVPGDSRPLAAIPSRAYFEWHFARGLDPFAPRGAITLEMRRRVILRDGLYCGICKKPIEKKTDVHLDHIKPVSFGGETTLDNLRVTHATCNMCRGNTFGAD